MAYVRSLRMWRAVIFFLCIGTGWWLPAQDPASTAWLSMVEIQSLPDTTLPLAFHFVALPDGRNFVLDPQDSLLAAHGNNEKLRANILVYYLLGELNRVFSSGMLDYPASKDTKIRFATYAGSEHDPPGIQLYGYGEQVSMVPEAYNVIFRYRPGKSPDGSTGGTGSRRIVVYNLLQQYLAGANDTWTPARNIGHEIGHALGLDHTFHCDNPCAGQGFDPHEECYGECVDHNFGSGRVSCYGSSDRQLLMAYGSQVHLTVCEVERMWNYLLASKR